MKYLHLFLLSFFFIISCSEDKVETTVNVLNSSKISIYPENIDITFTDTSTDTATFTLKISNPGNYKWNIANRPPWLMVSQEKGTITEDSIQFQAILDKIRIKKIFYLTDSFSIITNGAGSCQALVTISQKEYVRPEIRSKDIYFPSGVSSQLVTFYNPSKEYGVTFSMRTDDDWIIPNGKYLRISEGSEQRYNLQIDRSRLPEGESTGEVTVIFGGMFWRDSLFLPVRVDNP